MVRRGDTPTERTGAGRDGDLEVERRNVPDPGVPASRSTRPAATVAWLAVGAGLAVLGLVVEVWARVATVAAVPAFVEWHVTIAAAAAVSMGLVTDVARRRRIASDLLAPGAALVLLGMVAIVRNLAGPISATHRLLVPIVVLVAGILVADLVASPRPGVEAVVRRWTAVAALGAVFAVAGPTTLGSVRVEAVELRLAGLALVAGAVVGLMVGDRCRSARARWIVVAGAGLGVWIEGRAEIRSDLRVYVAVLMVAGALTTSLPAVRSALRKISSAVVRPLRDPVLRNRVGTTLLTTASRPVRVVYRALGRAGRSTLDACAPRSAAPERRLERIDVVAATAMAAVSLAFVLAGVAWAERVGWQPTGHSATIMARAHDVGTADQPLTGIVTSLGGHGGSNHPGPMLFDLLAAPVRLFGLRHGAYAGGAILALASWWVAVWAGWRAGGRTAALLTWATAAVIIEIPALGAVWEANNVSTTILAMFTVAVASWAASCGVRWAWCWAVFFASLSAQAYIPHGLVVIGPVLWSGLALAGLGLRLRPGPAARKVGGALGVGLVVGFVCWLQPLIDVLINDGGNVRGLLTQIEDPRSPVGPAGFPRAIAWMCSIPPRWTDITTTFARSGGAMDFVGGSVLVGGLLAVTLAVVWFLTWGRVGAVQRQLRTVAILVVLGAAVDLTQLPMDYLRSFSLGWLVTASMILWFAVGTDVVLAVGPWLARSHPPLLRPARIVVVVASLAVVVRSASVAPDQIADMKGNAFAVDGMVEPLVDGTMASPVVERGGPVLVLGMDTRLNGVSADTIVSNLIVRGVDTRVEAGPGLHYGNRRLVQGDWDGPMLWIVSGVPPISPVGTRVAQAQLDDWSRREFDRLADEAAQWAKVNGPVTLQPWVVPTLPRYVAGWVGDDPCGFAADIASGRVAVEDLPPGLLLTLMADLGIQSPAVPQSLLERAADLVGRGPIEVWAVEPEGPSPTLTDRMVRDGSECPALVP